MIGLQSWTIREIFNKDPSHAIDLCEDFEFIELAGTGDYPCSRFVDQLGGSRSRVKGAHLCSLGTDASEVREIVSDHIKNFPSLEWFAFFLDPSDVQTLAETPSERDGIYQGYLKQLGSYRDLVQEVFDESSGNDLLLAPKVVYHTYPPDFYPGQDDEPLFAAIMPFVDIQLDCHFASTIGFNLSGWLEAKRQVRIHSMHVSGTISQSHAVLPLPTVDSEISEQFKDLLRLASDKGIQKLIIEHEINPNSESEALLSLSSLREYLGEVV